jgi:hypothetical protein
MTISDILTSHSAAGRRVLQNIPILFNCEMHDFASLFSEKITTCKNRTYVLT